MHMHMHMPAATPLVTVSIVRSSLPGNLHDFSLSHRVACAFFGCGTPESSARQTMSWKLGTNTKVGDAFPDAQVDIGFVGLDPANRKSTKELNAGKKNLWVSLPGAFTPT